LKKDFHECPEFIELPVDGDANNKRWVLLDASPKYQVGTFDGTRFTPDRKKYDWTIFGQLKAGQCFSNAPDGRAIFIVWARSMKYGSDAPFASGFTLPLELSLRTASDGIRLYANPVKELTKLREKEVFSAVDRPIGGEQTLAFETEEKLLEVVLSVRPEGNSGRIELEFGADNRVVYHLKEKLLDDQPNLAITKSRIYVYDKEDGKVDLRLFIDRASYEVFAENGSVYAIKQLATINQPLGEFKLTLPEGKGIVESMTVYKLKSIWPENVNTLRYSK
jgi:sucrose-6-phosphate hydrolase SacC (GH32 family)